MYKISNKSYREAISIALEHKRAFLFERKEIYNQNENSNEAFIISSLLLNNNVSILLDSLKQYAITNLNLSLADITVPDSIKYYFNCEYAKIKLVSEILTEAFLEKVEKDNIYYTIAKGRDLYKIQLLFPEYNSIYFEIAKNKGRFTCSLLNSSFHLGIYTSIKLLTEDIIIGLEKLLFKNKELQLYSTVDLAAFYR